MATPLIAFVALLVLAWGSALPDAASARDSLPWFIQQQALYLSGLLAIALLSLAMVLTTRPAWLERPLGGMDRIYRLHKWAAIAAVCCAALHWLVEKAGDAVKATFGRPPEQEFSRLIEHLRDVGEELAEFAIVVVLALLVLSLWKRFPYKFWRHIHRAMPLLYLMLAFHAAVLAPTAYWRQPVGLVLAALLIAGSAAAMLSLVGRIGRSRQAQGRVVSVANPAADITEVVCRLDAPWRGHRAGQFALLRFDRFEGAHPFTIASAARADHIVTFQIKALGDFTHRLASRIAVGQPVSVEGPYGRFVLERHDRKARQIWVAGGIGITPFIAWLDQLRARGTATAAADLHYFARDPGCDPLLARVRELCAALPGVRLQVHEHRRGDALPLDRIVPETAAATERAELWFCGPGGLAELIRQGLRRRGGRRVRFHSEAFAWR